MSINSYRIEGAINRGVLTISWVIFQTLVFLAKERPSERWSPTSEYSKVDFNWDRNVTGQLLSVTINITFLLPKRLDKGRRQAKAYRFGDRTSNALSESVLRPLPAETRILAYLSRRMKGSSEGATQVSFETSESGMIFPRKADFLRSAARAGRRSMCLLTTFICCMISREGSLW